MQPNDQLSQSDLPGIGDFADFVPKFFEAAFHEADQVALCESMRGVPHSLLRDQAIEWLLRNQEQQSLCFAHDPHNQRWAGHATRPRSILLRVPFGRAGTGEHPVFAAFEEALAHVLTCPLRPSIAWRTHQTIELAYLVQPPYSVPLPHLHGVPHDITRNLVADYHGKVQNSLWEMLGGDSAEKVSWYLRVPLSKNPDRADTPRVQVLWCDFERRYDYAELERLYPYGIADILDRTERQATPNWTPGPEDSINVPFDELPQDIRAMMKRRGPPGKRLFRVVARMLKDGYSDGCIQNSVRHGGGFRWLDEGDESALAERVEDFIDQIRRGKSVYAPYLAPPIEITAIPEAVPLSVCAPLRDSLAAMLDKYEKAVGVTLAARVRDAARFFEHVFTTQDSGILESPCGSGKSVWALCHVSLHASATNRYLYVTETVDGLYDAAAVMEKLTRTPVGRVHGFRPEKCKALCGQTHDWQQCNPASAKSVCRRCQARNDCAFFTREVQLKRPILCLTHNGLIRVLEEDAAVLQDATLLVDENLSPFGNLKVLFADLDRLAQYVGRDDLNRFFPCTSFAHQQDLGCYHVVQPVGSFARRNYVYRSRDETAALGDVCDRLRQALRSGLGRQDGACAVEDRDQAVDTLVQLLNFFRPTTHGDAAYAYRESEKDGQRYVLAKRTRFSLATGRRYRKLWMLNASASLAPDPYPDSLPVFNCPDLPDNSSLVRLHVVRCNPTKIRENTALKLSTVPLGFGRTTRDHEEVLVTLDKESRVADEVRQMLKQAWDAGHPEDEGGRGPEIVALQRGRIKGANTAGDCTLALLTGMATFTGVDDCALHAALHYGRTFPDTPHVFTSTGGVNWPGGKMQVPAMRTYYALRSLDEIYQAVWRTAVRNDRPVEAIIALPDEHWLATLYRTVMPGLRLASAYRDREGTELIEVAGESQEFTWEFEQDERMFGMRLIEMAPGEEIAKKRVAAEFGYTGKRPWEKNKGVIMGMLGPFFEEGHNNRYMRRRVVSQAEEE